MQDKADTSLAAIHIYNLRRDTDGIAASYCAVLDSCRNTRNHRENDTLAQTNENKRNVIPSHTLTMSRSLYIRMSRNFSFNWFIYCPVVIANKRHSVEYFLISFIYSPRICGDIPLALRRRYNNMALGKWRKTNECDQWNVSPEMTNEHKILDAKNQRLEISIWCLHAAWRSLHTTTQLIQIPHKSLRCFWNQWISDNYDINTCISMTSNYLWFPNIHIYCY